MVARHTWAAAVVALWAAGAQAERSNDDIAQLEVSVDMQQHNARSGADIEMLGRLERGLDTDKPQDSQEEKAEGKPIKLLSMSSREEGVQVDQDGSQEVESEEDEQGDQEVSEDERVEVEGEGLEDKVDNGEDGDGKHVDAGEERPKVSELSVQELQAGEKMMELGAAAKAQVAVKSEAKTGAMSMVKSKAKTHAKGRSHAKAKGKTQAKAKTQATSHAKAQSGAQSGVQNNPASAAASTYDDTSHFGDVSTGATNVATATAAFKTAVDETKIAAGDVNDKYTAYDGALETLGTELENADVAREKYFRDQYAYYNQEEVTRNQPFTDYLSGNGVDKDPQVVDADKQTRFEGFFNSDGSYIDSGDGGP